MTSRRYRLMQVWVLAGGEEEDGWIEVAIYRSNGVVGRTRVRRARVYWYLRLVRLMMPLPEEWVRMGDGRLEEPLGVLLLRELVGEVRLLRAELAEARRPRRIRMGPEGMSISSWPPEDWGPIVETLRDMGWG